MISVPIGPGRFNFRVAGVWLHEGHVLLQGDPSGEFWCLPGGRVELMEPAEEALRRELREELALSDETCVGRLLWVMQNFFYAPEWGGALHELGLYFLINPTADDIARLADTTRQHPCAEPDSELIFRWFALADLPQTRPILPPFLNTALLDLPATPQIITDDRR
ncbi:MAG TPA: NUDIX domain-containing protein [Ktedonobacterales bacterium]